MSRNHDWWEDVKPPKSIAQWKGSANNTYFENPAKNVNTTTEQQEEQTDQRHTNPKKLHIGEKVADVKFRDISGWNSASKVQFSHYLTTRIVWEYKPLAKLKASSLGYLMDLLKLSPEAEQVSKSHLSQCSDWKAYYRDIRENQDQRPPIGQARDLGYFTLVRDQQLSLGKEFVLDSIIDPISSRTRSLIQTKRFSAITERMEEGAADIVMGEENDTVGDSGHASESDNGTQSTEFEGSFGTDSLAHFGSSEQSVADGEEYPPSQGGEETVNMAAVCFLRALSMRCPEATLEWEAYRKSFSLKLGEASIRATIDGCLRSKYGKDDIHAALEVKPFALTMKTERTLMQIGLEMLAFIVDCETKGKPRKRYFMEACFRHQFFLVVANFERENFLNYILRDMDPDDLSFLGLTLIGPFGLYAWKNIFMLGRTSLALTVQMAMESEPNSDTDISAASQDVSGDIS